MQQLRQLYISADSDGSVNDARVTWDVNGDLTELVLPLPLWVNLALPDVSEALTGWAAPVWLDSYAALCGFEPGEVSTFEDLWLKVMERNERWHYSRTQVQLPFDYERF